MRHKKVQKRMVDPDLIYKSRLVTKFVNHIMRDGKKTVAQKIIDQTFNLISKQEQDPLLVFDKAIQNVGPRQEVKARRVGGASYQVPVEVRGERKTSLAMRWILASATSKSSKEFHTFAEKLAVELMDAAQNRGDAIKKRDTAHRMAEANKAFSHFRF